jgi:hypothetical protein
MTKQIYLIKETYEKNATDGISYYTDINKLADAVYDAERAGGQVQVFKCVPIEHSVYPAKVSIELYDPETRESL